MTYSADDTQKCPIKNQRQKYTQRKIFGRHYIYISLPPLPHIYDYRSLTYLYDICHHLSILPHILRMLTHIFRFLLISTVCSLTGVGECNTMWLIRFSLLTTNPSFGSKSMCVWPDSHYWVCGRANCHRPAFCLL